MTIDTMAGDAGIYAGTFCVAVVGSLFPLVSIEAFLILITLGSSPHQLPALVLLAAAGQVLGKLPIYAAARGIAGLPGRHRERLERVRRWIGERRRGPHWIIGSSAALGLPPFSLIATAAGILAVRLHVFCTIVGVGRALRFAFIVGATSLA